VALARKVANDAQRFTDRHQIEAHTTEGEVLGLLDCARLERVLQNLLSNAVKYSPDGGTIRLDVSRPAIGEGWALIAVRDQGVGIPAADIPRLFERFFRATNVGTRIRGPASGWPAPSRSSSSTAGASR